MSCGRQADRPARREALVEAVADIKAKGAEERGDHLGLLAGQFRDGDARRRKILLDAIPDLNSRPATEIGRIGFLERENAAIMNASLVPRWPNGWSPPSAPP